MGGCNILGCDKRTERKKDGITFHRFPPNLELRKKCIDATGRHNWCPSKYARICSKHFDADCFIFLKKINKLKPFTIPTKYLAYINVENIVSEPQPSTSAKRISNCENIPLPGKKPKLNSFPVGTQNKIERSNILQDTQNINPIPSQILRQCSSDQVKNTFQPVDKTHEETLKKLEKPKQISATRLKKLRAVRESQRRLRKKVSNLEHILRDLHSKMFINKEEVEVLRDIEAGQKEFLSRFLMTKKSRKKYSPELRKFALCLHFISPKAYMYVRKTFNTCLPHPRTLYDWYKVIDCEPGFTKESFEAIKTLANKTLPKNDPSVRTKYTKLILFKGQ